jgi:hypothetical protein
LAKIRLEGEVIYFKYCNNKLTQFTRIVEANIPLLPAWLMFLNYYPLPHG